MTVGTYEYILGNLPWYIKWIAMIAGYRGSEERGFEYLVLAAEKSVFVNLDARVLLMVLYVREKEYAYGLQVAQQLHRRFPENFLINLNQAQILEQMGDREKAMRVYMDVIEKSEQGAKNYQKLPIETFRYTVGGKLAELDYPSEALALFLKSTRDLTTPPREKALSHLRAGELLDLMGRREEAIAQYEEVRRLRDFEGSHKAASRYLKRPFRR
jgi:tetratricopeptide (TPR) repeat protein